MRCTQAMRVAVDVLAPATVARRGAVACPPPGARLLGPGGPALRAALAAQLGHRRLHRPRERARHAAARRGHRRPQSAARAVPRPPRARSPYSPSSRLLLNPLYLDVEAVDDFARCARGARAGRERIVRRAPRGAARRRRSSTTPASRAQARGARAALRAASATRPARRHDALARRAFRAFVRASAAPRSPRCSRRCRRSRRTDPACGAGPCGRSPIAIRHPARAGVRARQAERVEFYEYLQWQADRSSPRRTSRARARHAAWASTSTSPSASIRGGAEAWAQPRLYARGAHVGAPPDDFNRKGQDWGLPPLDPAAPAQPTAIAPFIATLRANMRHAGALRIDHVMGLLRLYWVPPAQPATTARTCTTRVDELLRHRGAREPAQALPGDRRGPRHRARRAARARCGARGVLSYRLLYFERDGGRRLQAAGRLPARRRWSPSARTTCRRSRAVARARPRACASARALSDPTVAERAARSTARRTARGCCERSREGLLPPGTPAVGGRCDGASTRVHRLPRAHAARASDGAAGGRARRGRAGEPAGTDRRASELAPQAAGATSSDCGDDARFAASAPRCSRAQRADARGRCTHRRGAARASRAPPTACSCTASSRFDDATRIVPYLARAGRQPRLLLAVPARARRQHARLRHRRPRRAQPRDRRRGGLRRASRGAARARHGPAARHRAQPHGRARRRQRLVAGRAGERRRPRATRATSTSTGQPLDARRSPARCCCRCSATTTATVLERGELRAALRGRRRRASRCATTSTASRSTRATTPRVLLRAPARARATPTRRATRCARIADGLRAPAGARRAATRRAWPSAPRQGTAQGAARRARAPTTRRSQRIGASVAALNGRRRARASTRCTSCSRPGLPPRLLARGRRRDQLPALLRHQRPGRAAHGARGGVRGDARAASLELAARGRGRRPAHRPPRRPVRPGAYFAACSSGYASALAQRASDGSGRRAPLYVVVEKIARAARARCPRMGGARHHRLPLRQRASTACSSIRAREAALDRAWRGFVGERRGFDDASCTAASADHARTRWRASSRVLATRARCASRAPTAARATSRSTRCARALAEVVACLPGLPHLHRRRSRAARGPALHRLGGRAARERAAAPPTRSVFDFVRDVAARRPRAGAATALRPSACCASRALPAVHRAGDGQGRRGHGVLPLQPAGVAQRGRRRSARVRHHGRARSTARARDRARALAAHDARHLDARQQARARTCARASTCSRRCRRRGASRCAAGAQLNRAHRAQVDGDAGAVAQRRVPALPDAARHLAARPLEQRARRLPRAHRGLHAEGDARGEGAHELGQRRTRRTRRRSTASSTRCSERSRATRSSTTSCRLQQRIALRGLRQQPCADAHSSSPRPACPTSTRATSCGTSPWSIPTTAGRSTTRRANPCCTRCAAAPPRSSWKRGRTAA